MSNKKESKNEQKQYPSTDLLLNLCINEYQKETQRTSSIDTKTNIFLTLSTALYAFFIPLSDLKNVYAIEYSIKNSVVALMITFLVITSFISLLTATIIFISVISSRKYKAIDVHSLLKYADKEREKTSVVMCRLYDTAVLFNRQLNEKRMKLFKTGVISILFCIVLTTVAYILKVNFI